MDVLGVLQGLGHAAERNGNQYNVLIGIGIQIYGCTLGFFYILMIFSGLITYLVKTSIIHGGQRRVLKPWNWSVA